MGFAGSLTLRLGRLRKGDPVIEAWFDGVTEPHNPGGHAAYGIVVQLDGQIVLSSGQYVGFGPAMSNNVAEYAGITAILEFIPTLPPQPGVIRGDSKLVIMQLSGQWKAKGGLYLPYFQRAKTLYEPLRLRIQLEWVPRKQNEACDHLSKKVLHDRGIQFRIQT